MAGWDKGFAAKGGGGKGAKGGAFDCGGGKGSAGWADGGCGGNKGWDGWSDGGCAGGKSGWMAGGGKGGKDTWTDGSSWGGKAALMDAGGGGGKSLGKGAWDGGSCWKGGGGWDGSSWKGSGAAAGKGGQAPWGDPWGSCGGKDAWGGKAGGKDASWGGKACGKDAAWGGKAYGKDAGWGGSGKDAYWDGKGGGYKGGKGQGKFGKDPMRMTAAERIASGESPYFGTLRSFYAEKNCGYIVCDQVHQMTGEDVYIFRKVLEKCGAGVGDLIIFFLHWSARGQAQASSPILRLSASGEGNYALRGTFKATEAGYGFVQCPETRDYFGRDIYVSKTLAANFVQGQAVCLNVRVTPDYQPNAVDMAPCDESWTPTGANISVTAEDPTFLAGGYNADGQGAAAAVKRPAMPTGETMVGTLKTFSDKNNWGFIDCPEARARWGKDVWVVGHNLQDPAQRTVGAQLQFDVALNEKGMPQAINVVVVSLPEMSGEAAAAAAGADAGVGEWAAPAAASATPSGLLLTPGGGGEPTAKRPRAEAAEGGWDPAISAALGF